MKKTREEVIQILIEGDINDIMEAQSNDFIYNILRHGWCGYGEMTNDDLINEFINRFGYKLEIIKEE